MQLGAAGARKLEEVVDQLAHRLRRLAHSTEVIAAFLPEDIALLLDKDLAESVDRAKRCPQIVRDRVRERAELLVRRVHLGNAVLELPIQRPDLGEEIVAAQDERDLPGEEVHDLEIVLGEERRPRRVDREHAVPRSTPGDRRADGRHEPRLARQLGETHRFGGRELDHGSLLGEDRSHDRTVEPGLDHLLIPDVEAKGLLCVVPERHGRGLRADDPGDRF